MATPTAAMYALVPWIRKGLASQIAGQQTAIEATLPISLTVNGATVNGPMVRLLGPGDVTSIDPRAFIRTEPTDGADNFEPNYLAAVELATPDLPWMFTQSAQANGRLQPWISLVVLPEGDGVSITQQAGGVTILRIDAPLDPANELPDITEIDIWAHAQASGPSPDPAQTASWTAALNQGTTLTVDQLQTAFEGNTAASLSRLISPRKLEAGRTYIACVVPTFRAGVNAALGIPVVANDLSPAWDKTVSAPFSLPVYFQFRFQTGPGGDFASLATRIGPPTTPVVVGTRAMDISNPGFGLAPLPAPGASQALEGALCTYQTQPATGTARPYGNSLWGALNPGSSAETSPSLPPSPQPALPDPVVSPPTYGKTQTGLDLPVDGQQPLWMGDLNLDPGARAVAGVAGQVVQANAEAMAASAWTQIGEIRKANQLLRQGQLARQVTASINQRHLQTVAQDGSYLQITTPVHSRVSLSLAGTTATLYGHIGDSIMPAGAISGAMRRLTRPRGPLGRQLTVSGPLQIVERLNIPAASGSTALVVAGPAPTPAGMSTIENVVPGVQPIKLTPVALMGASGWQTITAVTTFGVSPTTPVEASDRALVEDKLDPRLPFGINPVPIGPGRGISTDPDPTPTPVPTPAPTPAPTEVVTWQGDPTVPVLLQTALPTMPPPLIFPTDSTALATMQNNFSVAAVAINSRLSATLPPAAIVPSLGGAPALSPVRTQLSGLLNPEITIQARLAARLPLNQATDPLQPLSAVPQYTQAMYAPLADLSPEWMLPGISTVPSDSAILLQTNARFVEAYMVGLNEDFARELLWRGFPAERTLTWFQYFWSEGGAVDIPPINQFDPAGNLGDHTQDHAASGRVALLIRANLFLRYPNTVVSAIKAQWSGDAANPVAPRVLSDTQIFPSFQGQIGTDINFFGFDLNDPDPFGSDNPADGKPGWYFVLEEHQTEPRFGLEPAKSTNTTLTWNDLSWQDLPDETFLNAATAPAFNSTEPVRWSESAAAMAYILMRRPARVAMHAKALVAEEVQS
jgi:hypothetical protein